VASVYGVPVPFLERLNPNRNDNRQTVKKRKERRFIMTAIPDIPTVPNPSARVDAAQKIAQQVRAIVETLPGLVFLTPEERARLRASATVTDRFMELGASAMDEARVLAEAGKLSAADIREVILLSATYRAMADDMERLERGVRDTDIVARSKAGTETLRVYSVARRLKRSRDTESPVSTLAQMLRTPKHGRPARGRSTAPPALDPVPPVTVQGGPQ
jgi:hypothetical protein